MLQHCAKEVVINTVTGFLGQAMDRSLTRFGIACTFTACAPKLRQQYMYATEKITGRDTTSTFSRFAPHKVSTFTKSTSIQNDNSVGALFLSSSHRGSERSIGLMCWRKKKTTYMLSLVCLSCFIPYSLYAFFFFTTLHVLCPQIFFDTCHTTTTTLQAYAQKVRKPSRRWAGVHLEFGVSGRHSGHPGVEKKGSLLHHR